MTITIAMTGDNRASWNLAGWKLGWPGQSAGHDFGTGAGKGGRWNYSIWALLMPTVAILCCAS
jgi:hypothetical protein